MMLRSKPLGMWCPPGSGAASSNGRDEGLWVSSGEAASHPHWAFSDGFLQWWQQCCRHVPWDQDYILNSFYSSSILGCLQDVLSVCFPVIILVERVGRVLAVIVGILRVVACMRCFLLRSSGLKVQRAQRCLRRAEWWKSLEFLKTDSRVVKWWRDFFGDDQRIRFV